MRFLSNITDHINKSLELNLMPYMNGVVYRFFGISDQLQFVGADGKEAKAPFVIDNTGEGHYIGPDDITGLSLYHKIENVRTTKAVAAFGDGVEKNYNAQMSMIVFASRIKTQIAPDEMAIDIANTFEVIQNKELGRTMKTKPVTLLMSGFIPNSYDVFNGEFKNVQYFLGPEYYLLKINYTATFDISNKCFSYC